MNRVSSSRMYCILDGRPVYKFSKKFLGRGLDLAACLTQPSCLVGQKPNLDKQRLCNMWLGVAINDKLWQWTSGVDMSEMRLLKLYWGLVTHVRACKSLDYAEACRLFGNKLLPKPILCSCQWIISNTFQWRKTWIKIQWFSSEKIHLQMAITKLGVISFSPHL